MVVKSIETIQPLILTPTLTRVLQPWHGRGRKHAREIYDLEKCAEFVSNFLHYEPLERPTEPPSCLPSSGQVGVGMPSPVAYNYGWVIMSVSERTHLREHGL